jgi:nitronate monooxygenase
MITLPKFKIGNLEINLIQGGMGVGVSGKNLASAVADCEGAGIIASVELGLLKGYSGSHAEANKDALRDEIRAAKKKSNGVIGVNIMRASNVYEELVKVASEENVDLIICGAGIAKDLPNLVGNSKVSLVPIVSDERVARIISRSWGKLGKVPDAFIVEGPEAGGHLGFKHDDLVNGTCSSLKEIVKNVINFADTNFDKPIPVIVAGGIYTGGDIAKYLKLGAAGVQMATRFVTTLECDVADQFKVAYLNAGKEDVQIIKSPVGMPGRAIMNGFLEKVRSGEKIHFNCASNCLISCKPNESPYCIADALINAQKGNLEEGFAFAGVNVYRSNRDSCLDDSGGFITVRTLIQRLSDEYHSSR